MFFTRPKSSKTWNNFKSALLVWVRSRLVSHFNFISIIVPGFEFRVPCRPLRYEVSIQLIGPRSRWKSHESCKSLNPIILIQVRGDNEGLLFFEGAGLFRVSGFEFRVVLCGMSSRFNYQLLWSEVVARITNPREGALVH